MLSEMRKLNAPIKRKTFLHIGIYEGYKKHV